jgi:hypothetical protein
LLIYQRKSVIREDHIANNIGREQKEKQKTNQ